MSLDLATLRQQLKTEKNKKGEISRQFKHLEKNSAEHRELLLAMQEISERITATEKSIKLAEELEQEKPEPALTEATQNPFSLIDSNSLWQGSFSCTLLASSEFSRWDIFINQHNASGYHLSCWFDLIKKSFFLSGGFCKHFPFVHLAFEEVPLFHGEVLRCPDVDVHQLVAPFVRVDSRKTLAFQAKHFAALRACRYFYFCTAVNRWYFQVCSKGRIGEGKI